MLFRERMVFTVKRFFPKMVDRPETSTIAAGFACWFFAYFALSFIIALFSTDAGQELYGVWMDIGYHVLNFALVSACFFPYLRDNFLTVQLHTKKFFKTVALGTVAVVAIKVLMFGFSQRSFSELFFGSAFGGLLTTEADLAYYSTALIGEQPIWGTLCVVFLTPMVTSCLLYACAFAPICTKRPWLAYVVMIVGFLFTRLMLIFCLWSKEQQIADFWVGLPVHLVACWTYQYTDTIWTPIAIHSISNLLLSLLALFYMGIL